MSIARSREKKKRKALQPIKLYSFAQISTILTQVVLTCLAATAAEVFQPAVGRKAYTLL
jgi:hypothetical protein